MFIDRPLTKEERTIAAEIEDAQASNGLHTYIRNRQAQLATENISLISEREHYFFTKLKDKFYNREDITTIEKRLLIIKLAKKLTVKH